ncbi:hypothetical protein G9A89_015242 [Geosiphon pyriformis]|nr:hypothetical protein G9A89_015242 [Geosiphon pyriformis]
MFGSSKDLLIQKAKSYDDGTILLQMGHDSDDHSTECYDTQENVRVQFCFDPSKWNYFFSDHCSLAFFTLSPGYILAALDELSFGYVISWNGTIVQSDIDLGIKQNFVSKTFIQSVRPTRNFLWIQGLLPSATERESVWTLFSSPCSIRGKQKASLPEKCDFSNGIKVAFTLVPSALESQLQLQHCTSSNDGSGNFCILRINEQLVNSFVKIEFLSTGAVTNIENFILSNLNDFEVFLTDICPLPYGGFESIYRYKNMNFLALYYKNGTMIKDERLNVLNSLPFNERKYVGFFPNNTFFYIGQNLSQNNKIIKIRTFPLKEIFQDGESNNSMIEKSDPPIHKKIPLRLKIISFTFGVKIKQSIGNISIFQGNSSWSHLRQTLRATNSLCSLGDDNRTISIGILSSTFNQPNSEYFVVIDNNFVKSQSHSQPLIRIQQDLWKFSTNVFEQILEEIADVLPIEKSRLSSKKNYQFDSSAPQKQLLFQLHITATNDKNQLSVEKAIDDLNILIKNKDISPIGTKEWAKFLDEGYSFHPKRKFINEFLLVCKKEKSTGIFISKFYNKLSYINIIFFKIQAENLIFLESTLIIIDLVLDVSCMLKNGKDILWLFIPSIGIFIISIINNVILTFWILMSDIKSNGQLSEWFQKHRKLASILTLIGTVDVELISILGSKIGGFFIFHAPFSSKAKHRIFLATTANVLIEDIPQLVIQILYQQHTLSYSTIPFISLIASSGISVTGMVDRIHFAVVKLQNGHRCKWDALTQRNSEGISGLSFFKKEKRVSEKILTYSS